MTTIQTIITNKEKFVQRLKLGESDSANLLISIIMETFMGVCFDGAYYQGAPAYLSEQVIIQVPSGRYSAFQHRMKEDESPGLNRLLKMGVKPVWSLRSYWKCTEEFLGILKELKFCEYDDIVLSPEYESEDEVMI